MINKLSDLTQLEKFINSNYQDIYDFFNNKTQKELLSYKKETKKYLRKAKKEIMTINCSKKINGDFIVILIEACEKLYLLMEFKLLYDHLSKFSYTLGDRLKAIYKYHSVKKFNDFYKKVPDILCLLEKSYIKEEDSKEKLTATFINFYLNIIYNYGERNKDNILELKNNIFIQKEFLDKNIINSIFSLDINNFRQAYNNGIDILNNYLAKNNSIDCKLLDNTIQIEDGEYAQKIHQLRNPNFKKIRILSKEYIMSIGNPDALHYDLNQGITIIQENKLLYKYLFSYGKMHKEKLYSSFDTVIHKLNGKVINIIDWGCGQALATSLLIDYIKEKNLQIDISNIILIEPSSLALSRGLLHIDTLKEKKIAIKTVNKDIDCLEINDLIINNKNITLHLFSNILDVEFFRLDKIFLEKISNSQHGLNYFICVSPNINDKRNARLDMFYRYFSDNFDKKLISARDSSIGKYKRYEKVFLVPFAPAR